MFRSKRERPRLEGPLKCGWCDDEIGEDSELFGIGAKAHPDINISEMEGKVIDVSLTRRNLKVQALVVANDSSAKREGKDLLFIACSESCAAALGQGVGREIELS